MFKDCTDTILWDGCSKVSQLLVTACNAVCRLSASDLLSQTRGSHSVYGELPLWNLCDCSA